MAHPLAVTVSREAGQVLAFFAVVLPVVLLPVAAYAVDATVVASRAAGLQAATAQAAEAAAQRLDVKSLRSEGALALDATAVRLAVSETLAAEEPGASVDLLNIKGLEVTVVTGESVTIPFSVFAGAIQLHARAIARLAPGYDNPS
jgi:hypothetical protein